MRRIKILLLLILAVGAVSYVALRVFELKREQQESAAASPRGTGRTISVDLTHVRTALLREELQLTGALKPKEQVDVTPKATGRLQRIYFRIGDLVQEGTLIAELEDEELRQQVNRAMAAISVGRAARAQREAEQKNAMAELERASGLVRDGLVSRQDYEARVTALAVVSAQLELAEAQIQQADAELRELKVRLEQSRIFSPMAGIVAHRYVDAGALVSPTTPLLRIVNLSTLVTQANVPEQNTGSLKVGNETVVLVDAVPGAVFRGRVARIAPVLDAATRSALVEIDVPNPNGLLRAEMFARIQLDSGRTRTATVIPRGSLIYRGQQPGVYVIRDDEPVFRAIEVGASVADDVEVISNLLPGTPIIGRGANLLNAGDRIRISNSLDNAIKEPSSSKEAAVQPAVGGGPQ